MAEGEGGPVDGLIVVEGRRKEFVPRPSFLQGDIAGSPGFPFFVYIDNSSVIAGVAGISGVIS